VARTGSLNFTVWAESDITGSFPGLLFLQEIISRITTDKDIKPFVIVS
jgi:hypothetical protein